MAWYEHQLHDWLLDCEIFCPFKGRSNVSRWEEQTSANSTYAFFSFEIDIYMLQANQRFVKFLNNLGILWNNQNFHGSDNLTRFLSLAFHDNCIIAVLYNSQINDFSLWIQRRLWISSRRTKRENKNMLSENWQYCLCVVYCVIQYFYILWMISG